MKLAKAIKNSFHKIKLTNRKRESIILYAKRLGWGALSFLLCISAENGTGRPFAVSLIAASGRGNILFAAIGAALGYICFCSAETAIGYFSAVIICTLGTLCVDFFKVKKEAWLAMLISSLSVLSAGLVTNARFSANAASYALTLAEAVLSLACSFFFYRAVNCNIKRIRLGALSLTDSTCVFASASIVLASFSSIELKGISPGRIFAVLIILAAVRFGSGGRAVIMALCLGFALGIGRENGFLLLGSYAFSALLSSLFTSFSSLAIGLCFVLSSGFFAVASGLDEFSLCTVAESVIGGVIFCILPEKIMQRISAVYENASDTSPDGSLRQSLAVRLRFASSALAQVSESVRDVREKINALGTSEPIESEIRMVAADQFFSVSDMLRDLAFEFDEAESFDFKAAGKIRRMLAEYDIFPENISVICDKYDRMRIEIFTPPGTTGLKNAHITDSLGKICRREFEKGRINASGAGILFSVTEKPNFKMNVGFAQYSAEGTLCGDTVKTINDLHGHMIFIISDGMGRGGRAALDGAMGAGLLSKLLSAGFGFDSSLKVVNSALLLKSSEESLATLDCACVDLYSGKCEFYKAGAPRSYIVKRDRLTKCELSSMPAGILRGIEFAKRTTMLNTGDEVIIMSDGITDVADDWLEKLLTAESGLDPTEKAQAVIELAKKHSDERRRDDMSVIVARLTEY